MKRLLFLLLFATSLGAQDFSIDFTEAQFDGREESYIYPAVRASGTFTAPVQFNWSYQFTGRQRHGGSTRSVSPDVPSEVLNLYVPGDDLYSGTLTGEVEITYTVPGTSQVVRKTAALSAENIDPEPTIIFDDLRMVETESGTVYSVGYTMLPRASIPIGVTVTTSGDATAGVDYHLLDTAFYVPALHSTGQIRLRVIDDDLPEDEHFFVSCAGRCQPGKVTIVDGWPQGYITPDPAGILAGELFELTIVIDEPQPWIFDVSVESSNPDVAAQLFRGSPAIRFNSGATTAVVFFRAGQSGSSTIKVTFPSSTHIEPMTAQVNVFGGDFAIDRDSLMLAQNDEREIKVTMNPPPPQPVPLSIFVQPAGVVTASPAVYIETDGSGTFTVKGRAAGSANIELRTETDRLVLSLSVQVAPPLTLAAIAPASGSTNGGTPVTISGQGFKGTCTAAFGTTLAATVTVVSETALKAVTPPHAAGVTDVKVTCDGNQATLAGAFTFIKPARGRSVRH